MSIEFQPFPKLARLTRLMYVTEKLDGTNAQVIVTESGEVAAASRTRLLTPEDDNYGFARWVQEHRDELRNLGPGRHFGEWWGKGIGRNYGLSEKRFSLFNTGRWRDVHGTPFADHEDAPLREAPTCCYVVPVLNACEFDTRTVGYELDILRLCGSVAARGFMQPEGVVVYHTAAGVLFKRTLEKDTAKDLPPQIAKLVTSVQRVHAWEQPALH